MMKGQHGEVVAYPEVLGELGVLVRKIQDLITPYSGQVSLEKILDGTRDYSVRDSDGCCAMADLTVRMMVSYNPQKFHQGILQASGQPEHTV
jgi:hypothetical protein